MDAEVLIAGGGIGGAALALALARAGHSVLILEREAAPPPARRPEVLWPPTLAALDGLGVGEAVREESLAIQGLEVWRARGARLVRVEADDFVAAGAQGLSTDPTRTRERILEAAVATGGVTLLRGIEVREVACEAGSAVVRGARAGEAVEKRGRIVVGDDGVHSRVRESAAIALPTEIFPLEIMGAVAPRPPDFPAAEARVWLDPAGIRGGVIAVGLIPLRGDRVAAVFPAAFETWDGLVAGGPGAFWKALGRITPYAEQLSSTLRFPEEIGHFRRPVGHAERYAADRLAILGDAAHPVTPAGGQGANMAVADALALAAMLVARLPADDLSAASLAPYEAARRAANERSIQISRRAGHALGTLVRFPFLASLLPLLFRYYGGSPVRRRQLLRGAATAFVS